MIWIKQKTKRYSRKNIYSGYCFDLVVDDVLWPNQKRLKRDLIIHPGISVIVPLVDKNHVILIRQFRYGAGRILWEIPAGTIDGGESALSCAKREIEEEIGFRARQWKKITSFFASPGFNTEIIHVFLASGLYKTKSRLEDDELLEAHIFSLKEAVRMVKTCKIRDAKSLVPLFYFLAERGVL